MSMERLPYISRDLARMERELKDALAREEALRRRQDELIRQLEILPEQAARRLASLTPRQRQIMLLVLNGQPSKNIAADLGISQRTVENHRALIMKRTATKSLPALARLALAGSESASMASSQQSAY